MAPERMALACFKASISCRQKEQRRQFAHRKKKERYRGKGKRFINIIQGSNFIEWNEPTGERQMRETQVADEMRKLQREETNNETIEGWYRDLREEISRRNEAQSETQEKNENPKTKDPTESDK